MIYVSFTDFCAPPPNFKFNRILSSGGGVVSCERTDGQTDGIDEAHVLCLICFSNARKSGKENEGAREGE